ncbi:MAG: hypothetical protein LBT69_01110 [Lactobacillales bacterium]|jgi:hypothetical protein|nr:hypothetical protein [Lactobacillales bacterium]
MNLMTDFLELVNSYKNFQEKKINVTDQVKINFKPALEDVEKLFRDYKFEIEPRINKINEKLRNIESFFVNNGANS